MRKALSYVQFKGRVVIGEGERDEAPMLFIGEEVGASDTPKVDIRRRSLEGTNIVSAGGYNAIAVIAIAEEGGFLHAPDTYMQKLAVARRRAGDRHHGDPDGEPPQDRQGAEGVRRGPLRGDPGPAAAPGPDQGGSGSRGRASS